MSDYGINVWRQGRRIWLELIGQKSKYHYIVSLTADEALDISNQLAKVALLKRSNGDSPPKKVKR